MAANVRGTFLLVIRHLAIGAAATVFVAVASVVATREPSTIAVGYDVGGWQVVVVSSAGGTRVLSLPADVESVVGWDLTESRIAVAALNLHEQHSVEFVDIPGWSRASRKPVEWSGLMEDARGWPWRALVARFRISRATGDAEADNWWHHLQVRSSVGWPMGIDPHVSPVPSDLLLPAVVPVVPTIGFLWSMLFYGASWWCLKSTGKTVRGSMRARRGCCRHCGYQLLSTTTCSECGRLNVKGVCPFGFLRGRRCSS